MEIVTRVKVAVHQPHYFPWLGLVHKIAAADRFVVLDDVQFTRRNYQHRTQYPTDAGPRWLILPVRDSDGTGRRLALNELTWGEPRKVVFRKHFETLQHRYGGAPGWPEVRERLRDLLQQQSESEGGPMALMIASMELTLALFGIDRPLTLASTLDADGARDEHNLHLTAAVGGTTYLSGQGARAYMRDELFEAKGIAVEYQEFVHPVYAQRHAGEFVSGCWALDMLICDPDGAREFARAALATSASEGAGPALAGVGPSGDPARSTNEG